MWLGCQDEAKQRRQKYGPLRPIGKIDKKILPGIYSDRIFEQGYDDGGDHKSNNLIPIYPLTKL
jgi:hypothetical protein